MKNKVTKKSLGQRVIDLRRQLNEIYEKQIGPLYSELHKLLEERAQELCPFKVGSDINFTTENSENVMRGQIKEISFVLRDKLPENYNATWDLDFKMRALMQSFGDVCITWQVSGLKYKKSGELGEAQFSGIGPLYYEIDKKTKTCTYVSRFAMLKPSDQAAFSVEDLINNETMEELLKSSEQPPQV